MIVVGSSAINFRTPNDIDIFSTRAEFEWLSNRYNGKLTENGGHFNFQKRFEFQFSDDWSSCIDIENSHSGRYVETPIGKLKVIDPEVLAILKKSHLYRQIEFYKHVRDFHNLKSMLKIENWNDWLKEKGLDNLYKIRLEDTKKHFPDRTPSLNKDKENFFNDFVVKFFYHDDIHFLMKHREKPMYEYCQNGTEVLCDKTLWEKLSHEDKINMVREEALVIGLERRIIPQWANNERYSRFYKDGFYYGVMRICTNLCRGWFREFAQQNYIEVINYDYEKKFNFFFDCVNKDLIKKYPK